MESEETYTNAHRELEDILSANLGPRPDSGKASIADRFSVANSPLTLAGNELEDLLSSVPKRSSFSANAHPAGNSGKFQRSQPPKTSPIPQNDTQSNFAELAETSEPAQAVSAKRHPDSFSGISGRPETWHTVTTYFSHGIRYYRYQWGCGSGVEQFIHIRGGDIKNPVAIAAAAKAREMIERGRSPQEIVSYLRS